jgi:hypothetical protein
MTALVMIAGGYLIVLAWGLAIVAAAKRGDEAMTREIALAARDCLEVLPSHVGLERLAADLGEALGAERVTVIVRAPDERDTGIVGACLGVAGLVGCRVPVGEVAVSGVLDSEEAALFGLAREDEPATTWAYAHVPVARTEEGVVGAVMVASRTCRPFTGHEMGTIERLATRNAGRFARSAPSAARPSPAGEAFYESRRSRAV